MISDLNPSQISVQCTDVYWMLCSVQLRFYQLFLNTKTCRLDLHPDCCTALWERLGGLRANQML